MSLRRIFPPYVSAYQFAFVRLRFDFFKVKRGA